MGRVDLSFLPCGISLTPVFLGQSSVAQTLAGATSISELEGLWKLRAIVVSARVGKLNAAGASQLPIRIAFLTGPSTPWW